MGKNFLEVFKTIELDKRNKELFEDVVVNQVSATESRDFVRILISSDHLIPKASIYRVEKLVRKALFGKRKGVVKILETFSLSDQYTPEILFEEYRDSISLELENYGVVEKTLFDNAEVSFPEKGVMLLTVTDTGFLESKKDELKRVIEKVFTERCGVVVEVTYEFIRPEKVKRDNYEFVVIEKIPENDLASDNNAGETADEKNADTSAASKDRKSLTLEGRYKDKKKNDDKYKNSKPTYEAKLSDNPDVLFGRDFEDGEFVTLGKVFEASTGDVLIHGQIVFEVEPRPLKDGERTMLMYDVSDYTDSIRFKLFIPNDRVEEVREKLKVDSFVVVKGPITFDKYDEELSIGRVWGIKKGTDFRIRRKDNYEKKRVELHCHTKMSDMDGVSATSDIVKCAYGWGHPAIAITDHGVVHAFPDANHTWEDLWKKEKQIFVWIYQICLWKDSENI